MQEKVKAPK